MKREVKVARRDERRGGVKPVQGEVGAIVRGVIERQRGERERLEREWGVVVGGVEWVELKQREEKERLEREEKERLEMEERERLEREGGAIVGGLEWMEEKRKENGAEKAVDAEAQSRRQGEGEEPTGNREL